METRKFHHQVKIYEAEGVQEYDKWVKLMPALEFPRFWKVRILPPFGGAMVRFQVVKGSAKVSVYFDAHGRLGAMDSPYWEIYSNDIDDNERFLLGDEKRMLIKISRSLTKQRKAKGEKHSDR